VNWRASCLKPNLHVPSARYNNPHIIVALNGISALAIIALLSCWVRHEEARSGVGNAEARWAIMMMVGVRQPFWLHGQKHTETNRSERHWVHMLYSAALMCCQGLLDLDVPASISLGLQCTKRRRSLATDKVIPGPWCHHYPAPDQPYSHTFLPFSRTQIHTDLTPWRTHIRESSPLFESASASQHHRQQQFLPSSHPFPGSS